MSTCVFISHLRATPNSLSHLVHSWQRACVLLVSITASPQWALVPQGAFLPQGIIQDVILLTSLLLNFIEIHGWLHGRVVLKAPSCRAADDRQWTCGPPPLCSQRHNVSKRKSTSCDGCGGPASAASHTPNFLFSSFFAPYPLPFASFLLFCKAKKKGHSFCITPLQKVPFLFAVLTIWFMVCQKSAIHEKPAHLWSRSTCLQFQSQFLNRLSFSLPVFCQAERLLLRGQTKGWLSLRPMSLSPKQTPWVIERKASDTVQFVRDPVHTQRHTGLRSYLCEAFTLTSIHFPLVCTILPNLNLTPNHPLPFTLNLYPDL